MRKALTLLIFQLVVLTALSQPPQRFSFQALIRDNAGQPVQNQDVSMRISILTDSIGGTSVYTETHKPRTSAQGIVNLSIGGGSGISGEFSKIPWSSGRLFVRTETDILGGTNYTLVGTTQFLSVPYALNAADVPVSKSGDTLFIGTAKLLIPGATLLQGSTPPPTIGDGLIAYYPFSGNAGDSSGKGNHATVNGATLTTDRLGRAGRAYQFNGTNQNIVTPALIKGVSKFSISFWFKLNNWNGNCVYGKYLFSANYTTTQTLAAGDGVSIGRHPMTNTENLLFGIFDLTPGNGWDWLNTGLNPDSTKFYHLAATYDGSTMKLFLNGELIGSRSNSKTLYQNTDKCFIGSSSYSCSYVNAIIDEFRFHNRALSASEIAWLAGN